MKSIFVTTLIIAVSINVQASEDKQPLYSFRFNKDQKPTTIRFEEYMTNDRKGHIKVSLINGEYSETLKATCSRCSLGNKTEYELCIMDENTNAVRIFGNEETHQAALIFNDLNARYQRIQAQKKAATQAAQATKTEH